MTTPASNTGAGGLWQNQAYPVNTAQSLYNFTGFHAPALVTVPPPANGTLVPTATLGGSGPYAGNPVIPVAQFNSYELWIGAYANNGTATGLILTVELLWFDTLTDTIPIDHIRWDIPAGVTSATIINTTGHGPMRGQYMMILFSTQNTPTATTNVQMAFTGIMRTYTSDDWRSDAGITGATGGASSATPWTGELCMAVGVGIPGNSIVTRSIFLYAGEAFLHVDNSSAAGTLQCQVQTWDATPKIIVFNHPAESNGIEELIIMPRVTCTIELINIGAGACVANFALIANRL